MRNLFFFCIDCRSAGPRVSRGQAWPDRRRSLGLTSDLYMTMLMQLNRVLNQVYNSSSQRFVPHPLPWSKPPRWNILSNLSSRLLHFFWQPSFECCLRSAKGRDESWSCSLRDSLPVLGYTDIIFFQRGTGEQGGGQVSRSHGKFDQGTNLKKDMQILSWCSANFY